MKLFAVFGNPIKQSVSPTIHQHFAAQFDIEIEYERQLSEVTCFENDIQSFFSRPHAVGCNVTAPFKEQAFELVAHADAAATLARAVNTIYLNQDGDLCGANTDGKGLISDIKRFVPDLNEKRVLLLGAGGAARGTLDPFVNEGVAIIDILNRTFAKAKVLVDEVNLPNVTAINIDECKNDYDIIVNCTSAGLTGSLPEVGNLSFESTLLTYDMVYKKMQTPFLLFAEKRGSKAVCDGLGMLVGQAAEAFTIWTGLTPDIQELIVKLREEMP